MVAATPVPQFVVSHAPPSSMAMTGYQGAPPNDRLCFVQPVDRHRHATAQASPIMEKLINIEDAVDAGQARLAVILLGCRIVRSAATSRLVWSIPRAAELAVRGVLLRPAVRENVTKAGVPSAHQDRQSQVIAGYSVERQRLRNSYFYDHARRTLYPPEPSCQYW